MEKNKKTRKEWTKNAIIIFLIIMLILTFCSDWIMNMYLPEVSVEAATGGKIENMLRGEGTAELNDSNQVKVAGNRVVKTVNVKVGKKVKTGDVLFTLEKSDGSELENARSAYLDMQTEYQKKLIEKAATYDEQTVAINSARREYKEALDVLNSIDNQSKKLKKKQEQLNEYKKVIAGYEEKIADADKQIANLENKSDPNYAQSELVAKQRELVNLKNELSDLTADLKSLKDSGADKEDITQAERNLRNKQVEVNNAEQDVKGGESLLAETKENKNKIEQLQKDRDSYNKKLDEYKEMQTILQSEADALQAEIPSKKEAKASVSEKEAAWNSLIASLEKQKEEDNYTAESDRIDMAAMKEKIDIQKKNIEELEKTISETDVKAEIDGFISEVNCAAGDTTDPEMALAVIASEHSNYIVKVSLSRTVAGRIKQGQKATVDNFWSDNIKAHVTSITNDIENTDKVIVSVEVKGEDIMEGDTISVSFGGESKYYDVIVPKSSVYSDNNGKFVLTLDTKRTPLGERYIVNRHDVEVVAEDDTRAAITSDLYGYEYVVMTSSEALTPGDQVKLKD